MNAISLKNLYFEWVSKEGNVKIGPIDASCTQGKTIGVFGKSGSGKSTILRIVLGELSPQSGSIDISSDMKSLYHDQVRKLIPWLSSEKNILLNGHSTATPLVKKALNICGIKSFANKTATELSGGQRARVALARTLIEKSDILLLDEPFAGIDIKNRENIVDQFEHFTNESIVFITSHDPGILIQLCDDVLCLISTQKETTSKIFTVGKNLTNLSPAERKNSGLFTTEVQRLLGVLYE